MDSAIRTLANSPRVSRYPRISIDVEGHAEAPPPRLTAVIIEPDRELVSFVWLAMLIQIAGPACRHPAERRDRPRQTGSRRHRQGRIRRRRHRGRCHPLRPPRPRAAALSRAGPLPSPRHRSRPRRPVRRRFGLSARQLTTRGHSTPVSRRCGSRWSVRIHPAALRPSHSCGGRSCRCRRGTSRRGAERSTGRAGERIRPRSHLPSSR